MSRGMVIEVCRGFPGAEVSDPWGGRMFAVVGAVIRVSVKTDEAETAEKLTAAGVAERAARLHRAWVRLPEDGLEDE